MSNETSAQFLRTMHPMRLQRSIWSSRNPLAVATCHLSKAMTSTTDNQQSEDFVPAKKAKKTHHSSDSYARVKLPAIESMQQDNLFLQVEQMFMDSVRVTLDFWRDWQGRFTESVFFGVWSMPWFREYGKSVGSRRLLNKDELHELPKVEEALTKIAEGDFSEAVVRMMILCNIVADNNIDRDQLMRLTEVLTEQKPFTQLSHADLAAMIHTQTLIVRFAEDASIKSLSTLIKAKSKRIEAFKLVCYVVGNKLEDKNFETVTMMRDIKAVLNLTDADIK